MPSHTGAAATFAPRARQADHTAPLQKDWEVRTFIEGTKDRFLKAAARIALISQTYEHNLTTIHDRARVQRYITTALPRVTPGAWEQCPDRGGDNTCSGAKILPKHNPGPSCLIIVCGLLRYYREGWRSTRERVIAPNPEVRFGVAMLTSAHLTCTDKDRRHGE